MLVSQSVPHLRVQFYFLSSLSLSFFFRRFFDTHNSSDRHFQNSWTSPSTCHSLNHLSICLSFMSHWPRTIYDLSHQRPDLGQQMSWVQKFPIELLQLLVKWTSNSGNKNFLELLSAASFHGKCYQQVMNGIQHKQTNHSWRRRVHLDLLNKKRITEKWGRCPISQRGT